MNAQELYQRAILFAAAKHTARQQCIPGTNLPYVVHLSNVAMEILIAAHHSPHFDLNFALQVALLHDTLEDTDTTFEELIQQFGAEIAKGVQALTKNDSLPKADRMADSLARIKQLRTEVWAVKLADRITNLQAPPSHWNNHKIADYQQEATLILNTLHGANAYLENRLAAKIEEYGQYKERTPADNR